MQTDIVRSRTATAISKETCHGIGRATLKWLSQNILGVRHKAILRLESRLLLPIITSSNQKANLFGMLFSIMYLGEWLHSTIFWPK